MNRSLNKDNQGRLAITLALTIAFSVAVLLPLFSTIPQSQLQTPNQIPGQSATVLPDGRVLLLGGESAGGSLSSASIWDPHTGTTTSLPGQLNQARAWHTATMLPDGMVFIFGGVGSSGEVISSPELFDPITSSFILSPSSFNLSPRSRHTATLLTDGHVLIAGGVDANGQALSSAELFDPFNASSVALSPLSAPRRSHTATLLADGNVLLWGGTDASGSSFNNGEYFNSASLGFTTLDTYPSSLILQPSDSPYLAASLPPDGSSEVLTESIIALRFSKPMRVDSVNNQTVSLSGPKGVEAIKVVPAEGGMLAFLTPEDPLLPGSTYTVSINGPVDKDGLLLPVSGFTFTTKGSAATDQSSSSSQSSSTQLETQDSKPETLSSESDDSLQWKGEWRDGKPYSPWQDLPPLKAYAGVTALAGQVLNLRGEPLANVSMVMESGYGGERKIVQTDDTGRFLLRYIDAGWLELIIDGRVARRRVNPDNSTLGPQENHGVFEYGLEIKEGQTTVLPFTIWLPKLDTAHAVKISSPTTSEVVVTTPKIPGLELRLAPATVITDYEGGVVTEVSLTRIPLDRTPFPLPRDVEVPIYFTAQPGGAYVASGSGIGARLHYPNLAKQSPGSEFNFWHYSPSEKWWYDGQQGWYVYGRGRVTPDGSQIIPHPGVSVYAFTGAMVASPTFGPQDGPRPDCDDSCDADPVDVFTGLFLRYDTDFNVPDVMPLTLTRTYRQRDSRSRAFGVGTTFPYEMLIVGDTSPWTYVEIVMPDGGRIRYNRISPGTSWTDAVYEHNSTPSRFYKSTISWISGSGWELKLIDGTVYSFPSSDMATRPAQAALTGMRDRYGNALTFIRNASSNLTRIVSPSGRWLEFTYDSGNRVTQAKDNIGRTVNYTYDASGRLWKVTDAAGGVTEYTYDAAHNMISVKNPRGITVVTNEYYPDNRIKKQTVADGGTYQFAYTLDANGRATQADVTDPRGNVTRRNYNADGYTTSVTRALGTAVERTTTYDRVTGTNQRNFVVDSLGRKTAYTYDTKGNVLTATRLADTPQAVTTTYTYEPAFSQVKTITDPLGHTTTFDYDSSGNMISVQDPLGNLTTYQYNGAGQPISIKDPLNNVTQFAYEFGDLVAATDPLGNATTRFTDAAGRLLSMVNPLGHQTLYDYDSLNRLTQVNDALNGLTGFGYDPNGNLLSVTDARNNSTVYTYNNMDRLESRRDPLLKVETYEYDLKGNLTRFIDRKNQAVTYNYDSRNRRTQAVYADLTTTTYNYDAGDRLFQIVDSVSGTITREYDNLDRLTQETTPQGSVTYGYDAAGRRTSMTVFGQPTINYDYDDADRLIQITQGSSIVSFAYDEAGRRTSLTLPNGVLVEYTYDAASRVTEITYKQGGTTLLGNLTYEYDKAGNRTKIGGSFARSGIPQTVNNTNYNAANQQTTFEDKTLTYDNNGNLTSITDANGTTLYSWNAKNQLTGISGPNVNASFVYDGAGRREKKTINGNLTEFLYDGVNPVQESSGAAVLANILTGMGIDEFFARTDVGAGTTSTLLSDALGSTIALANSVGTIQTENAHEAFGRTTSTGDPNSNPFQYTGRENDGTGLYYYRARYYQPEFQRFLSEDPIGFDGGDYNLYAYVANKPLNHTDPYGLFELPNSLKEQIIPEILNMVVTQGIGGITGAACASYFCRSHLADIDYFTHAAAQCNSIFHKNNIPLGLRGSWDLAGACADECQRITRTQEYKKLCCAKP